MWTLATKPVADYRTKVFQQSASVIKLHNILETSLYTYSVRLCHVYYCFLITVYLCWFSFTEFKSDSQATEWSVNNPIAPPTSYEQTNLSVVRSKAKVLYDYFSENDQELSLIAEEVIG